jgi:hypothetical protein
MTGRYTVHLDYVAGGPDDAWRRADLYGALPRVISHSLTIADDWGHEVRPVDDHETPQPDLDVPLVGLIEAWLTQRRGVQAIATDREHAEDLARFLAAAGVEVDA